MRVMVVARLFTGVADGLAEGVWRPRGAPAAYRLLEALAADKETELLTVFASKDENDHRFSHPWGGSSFCPGCAAPGWRCCV